MKTKKNKIKVQISKETLDQFMKDGARTSSDKDDLVLYFPNWEMVWKILSRKILQIIEVVRKEKPDSINELAKLLGRAQANVHKDVHYLAKLGILDLKKVKTPGKKAETVQPRCRWSGFDIDLAS
jgi:predicted transcriptional regulator